MHTAKSLKDKKKLSHRIFIQPKKNVLTCILALITNLLKPRELGQYFKNIWIMNLYVKHIPDIKKEVPFFIDVRMVRFLPDKIRISLLRRTFLKL